MGDVAEECLSHMGEAPGLNPQHCIKCGMVVLIFSLRIYGVKAEGSEVLILSYILNLKPAWPTRGPISKYYIK